MTIMEALVDILCLCPLAKSKTAVAAVDEKWWRTYVLNPHQVGLMLLLCQPHVYHTFSCRVCELPSLCQHS
jgi:hypothetical protein